MDRAWRLSPSRRIFRQKRGFKPPCQYWIIFFFLSKFREHFISFYIFLLLLYWIFFLPNCVLWYHFLEEMMRNLLLFSAAGIVFTCIILIFFVKIIYCSLLWEQNYMVLIPNFCFKIQLLILFFFLFFSLLFSSR